MTEADGSSAWERWVGVGYKVPEPSYSMLSKTNDFQACQQGSTGLLIWSGISLHLTLPMLKALHKAWSMQASSLKYEIFHKALEAGTAKINKYYEKMADSDAYTFAMDLFFISAYPTLKLTYFSP